jgi:hypothetical protein
MVKNCRPKLPVTGQLPFARKPRRHRAGWFRAIGMRGRSWHRLFADVPCSCPWFSQREVPHILCVRLATHCRQGSLVLDGAQLLTHAGKGSHRFFCRGESLKSVFEEKGSI